MRGVGEWQTRCHGPGGRRHWRKVHMAMDVATGEFRGVASTSSGEGGDPMQPSLLDQAPPDQALGTVTPTVRMLAARVFEATPRRIFKDVGALGLGAYDASREAWLD